MRMMMTGAAFAALMLAACNPQANGQKPGDPAPPNPTQTVAAPAEKPVYRFKIGALDAIALFDGAADTLLSAPRGHVAVIQSATLAELPVETLATAAWSLLPR